MWATSPNLQTTDHCPSSSACLFVVCWSVCTPCQQEDWWCAVLHRVSLLTPFRPLLSSTNSVYNDIEMGQSWQGVESGQVDLSQLT